MFDAKLGFAAANALVVAMIAFVMMNLMCITPVRPADGEYTTERMPEFSWGGMHGEFVLLIDDAPEFANPIEAKVAGNSYRLEKELDFGKYYWMVKSLNAESPVRTFTIGSSVVISRDQGEVANEGNTDIIVHTLTGAMVVGVGNFVEVGEENVKAEQT